MQMPGQKLCTISLHKLKCHLLDHCALKGHCAYSKENYVEQGIQTSKKLLKNCPQSPMLAFTLASRASVQQAVDDIKNWKPDAFKELCEVRDNRRSFTGERYDEGDDAGIQVLSSGITLDGQVTQVNQEAASDIREELLRLCKKEAEATNVTDIGDDIMCGSLWSEGDINNATLQYFLTAQLASGDIVEGEGYELRHIKGKMSSVAEQDGWLLYVEETAKGDVPYVCKCHLFVLVKRPPRAGLNLQLDSFTRRVVLASAYRLERVSSRYETAFDEHAALMCAYTERLCQNVNSPDYSQLECIDLAYVREQLVPTRKIGATGERNEIRRYFMRQHKNIRL
jgi:hypothetical protein